MAPLGHGHGASLASRGLRRIALFVAARIGYKPAGGGAPRLRVVDAARTHLPPPRSTGAPSRATHRRRAPAADVRARDRRFGVPVIIGFILTRPLPRLDGVVAQWPLVVQAVWTICCGSNSRCTGRIGCCTEVPLFWRFHKIHHSSQRLDWIAGARVHPFDRGIGVGSRGRARVPARRAPDPIRRLRRGPGRRRGLVARQRAVAVAPAGRVVATTEFHHWHHSLGDDARDANFAAFLPIFDVIFGTYHMPPDARPERYGVWDHVPHGWWAQLKDPVPQPRDQRRRASGILRHAPGALLKAAPQPMVIVDDVRR